MKETGAKYKSQQASMVARTMEVSRSPVKVSDESVGPEPPSGGSIHKLNHAIVE